MKHDVICKLCNTMYSLFYDNKILVKPLIETQEKKGGGEIWVPSCGKACLVTSSLTYPITLPDILAVFCLSLCVIWHWRPLYFWQIFVQSVSHCSIFKSCLSSFFKNSVLYHLIILKITYFLEFHYQYFIWILGSL